MTFGIKTLKIMMIGSHKVGKSTIIRKFIEKEFLLRYRVTIGVEFKTKEIFINGRPIKLLLGDCGGQKSFGNLRRTYYTGAKGCIVVYDVTDRSSFEAVDEWIREFRSTTREHVPLVLVGNKIDLAHERQVSYAEGEIKAKDVGATFFETSARLGTVSIDELFENLARRILKMETTLPAGEAVNKIGVEYLRR
ncbi:MAG: Rab family GTPase [Candidatus Hodarchaeota archaeon]